MSTEKTADSGRYSEICGATNSEGEPCQLPAGWGTPGSGGDRCRFHGGCSTGPDDTDYLEGNTYAEGNDGGGAPDGNTNAEIHGGWSDWRKAYDRFDDETREEFSMLFESYCTTATEHAPKIAADRRQRLAKEMATIHILRRRSSEDVWCDLDGSGPGRGLIITDDTGRHRVNPAHKAAHRLSNRQREIAEELRLWPGFQ